MAKEQPMHWADQAAKQVIKIHGDKDKYTIAAGITPSGTIHIGNCREILTVDLVGRALKDLGKEVRFIYSWDDIDVFRKVPKNLPKQDLLKEHLRQPLFLIPDVYGTHENYAVHNEAEIEKDLPLLGIKPEFIQQHLKYQAHDYAEGIKTALENTAKIKVILNKYRKEDLADSWLPVFVFCDKCKTDKIKSLEYKGEYNLSYECECGNKKEIDFRKEGLVTLRWRVDWPMRWDYEKVDFEPAGKDHFAAGGSRATGVEIQKAVYNATPPHGFVYEWIAIKGGKQFASSLGQVITLAEMLEVYEPEIVRYLFAGTRPSGTFEISFDADVLKIYEDFDKCERMYYKEQEADEKEYAKQKRIYELSSIDKPAKEMPMQVTFRHLTNLVQIHEGDIDKVLKELKVSKTDEKKIRTRAKCALHWLEFYADDQFKYKVQEKVQVKLPEKQKHALHLISEKLKTEKYDEKTLFEEFYSTCQTLELSPKDFFKAAYKVLINKEKGPKLAPFVLLIKDRAIHLFEQA